MSEVFPSTSSRQGPGLPVVLYQEFRGPVHTSKIKEVLV